MIFFMYGIFTFFITILFYILVYKMLADSSVYQRNYKGNKIVNMIGVMFIPVVTISLAFALYYNLILRSVIVYMLLLVYGMGFAGLLDDFAGSRNVTGIYGHMKELIKGNLTTGAFKALMGLSISFIIVFMISQGILNMALNLIIIILSINLMNLLDLRPGRAIKGFLCLGFLPIVFMFNNINSAVILPVYTGSIICLSYDLKEKAMLGDTGANILGAALGYGIVLSMGLSFKIIYAVLLITIHIISEFYSISVIIDKFKFLRALDGFGRTRS